jgi:hypothetical protein
MGNEVAKPQFVDGFEQFTDEVEGNDSTSDRLIVGPIIKFTNDSTWVTNGGDEELPNDLELVVVNVARVVQKWVDQRPVKEATRILQPGEKWPDIKKLNADAPRSEWREGPDGKPQGPWQAQYLVYLLNMASVDRYTFATGTTGGGIAVRDLVDRTCLIRQFRGQNVYAVVTLADVFMPTRFGGRQRPHFRIQRFVALGGDGGILPAASPPALNAPTMESSTDKQVGAQTVEPPTNKEAMKDEVLF